VVECSLTPILHWGENCDGILDERHLRK